jgi:hypothetical protein
MVPTLCHTIVETSKISAAARRSAKTAVHVQVHQLKKIKKEEVGSIT